MMKRVGVFLLILCVSTLSIAQFSDDFSDGDFTINPTWSGDNALFVDTLGMLRSNSTGAASYYLSTPSTLATLAEWEFYFDFQFGTSGVNYCDVFLTSDNADLTAAANGYFVRIGGTPDEISLYKLVGGTETILIDGTDGLINSTSSNPFKVRVKRNGSNVWSLEYDDGALGSYVLEGSITDNSTNTSTHFGFLITQSSAASPVKGHFFDDVNVTALALDVTPPQISSLTVISSTEIDVDFNEPIDQTTAETTANYSVNGGIGNPTTAILDANTSTVHLTFGTPFTNGNTYLLTATNIDDISANTMIMDTISFTFFIPSYKDIIFNEIHPAPSTLAEFVELYNTSAYPIELSGFKFTDASTSVSTLESYSLGSNEYLTICAKADTALFSGFGNVLGVSSFPTLNNSGDGLVIRNASGTTLDTVTYSDSWYGGISSSGVSLELINPSNPCSSSLNWGPSTDPSGHTAGQQNSIYSNVQDTAAPEVATYAVLGDTAIAITFNESIDTSLLTLGSFSITSNTITTFEIVSETQILLTFGTPLSTGVNYQIQLNNIEDCIGNTKVLFVNITYIDPTFRDVVISEIHPDPDASYGLPAVEFIELYNSTSLDYDLTGFQFTDASSTVAVFDNLVLGPNDYVTICKASDTALFSVFGNVLGVSSFPTLNNGGDDLQLLTSGGVLMDAVNYTSDWYQGVSSDGRSLEIINPGHPCSLSSNWAASLDTSGGTPSQINSRYNDAPDTEAPGILSFELLKDTALSITFTEPIDTNVVSLGNFTLSSNSFSQLRIISSTTIELKFSTAIAKNNIYTVTISNIGDCVGNLLLSETIEFGLGIAPAKLSVLINEILPDETPKVGLPTDEFIELYNSTSDIISLEGCYFTDFKDTLWLSNVNMLSNEYLILSTSLEYYVYGNAYISSQTPGLNNGGEQIALISANNEIIHTITYSDDWYNDADKDGGGWSLEMVDPSNPCSGDDNWAVSEDESGGTPGRVNSVDASNPDLDGPQIERAVALNDSTVYVYFNEILDEGSVVLDGFTVNNSQSLKSIILLQDKSTVSLKLSSKLVEKVVYTVTANGISDCVGNTIGSPTNSAEFALPEDPAVGDLIINEILFNTFSGGKDFVEIVNNSDKYIDLKNIYLLDYDNDSISDLKQVINDYYVVAPNSYVWLTENFNDVADFYPKAISTNYIITDLPTYSNAEGTVAIGYYEQDSIIVADRFDYLDDYHYALLDDEKGVSLERVTFGGETNDPNNWHSASSSEGYATPGYLNSQQMNIDGIEDQIVINPQVFTPDNDGDKDFTFINYSFDENGYTLNLTIYDSHGRMIKKLVQNELVGREGFYQWDGIDEQGQKAPVGYYIVLVQVFDLDGNTNQFKKKLVVGTRF